MAEVIQGGKKLDVRDVRYGKNKARLEKAYGLYIKDKEGNLNQLLDVVSEFARGKLFHSLADNGDSATTPDDYAQEVSIKVWKNLGECSEDPNTFYAWLNRICFTTGADAHEEIDLDTKGKVPLFIESEEEPGIMEDNPLIYRGIKAEPVRKLPEFIKGTDLVICKYIREGLTYKSIGEIIGLTESAVKLRVENIRKKVQKAKKEKQNA